MRIGYNKFNFKIFQMKKIIKVTSFIIAFTFIITNALLQPNSLGSDLNLSSFFKVASADSEEPAGCTGSTPIYCFNGGCGANACSVEGGIEILGVGVTAAGSTACEPGFFACCTIKSKCYSKTSYYESQNVFHTDL